ncbi:MAG: hypothetical protein FWH10_06830 [Oscillospiraceae bacterium]|nr:hypothetical protein [Oscillospiraceae bacterium]
MLKINLNLKKIFAIITLIAVTLAVLTACGGDNSGENPNGLNNNDPGENPDGENAGNDGGENAGEERIYPDLPAVDFGGYEFTFLTRDWESVVDWEEWNHRDLYAEQLNGDNLNDVVYNRNKKIEEKYNITINEVGVEDRNGVIRRTVRSGDDDYDVVSVHLMDVAALAQDGTITDILKVPNLDFDKPWWNSNTIRDLSVGGRLFVMQGDLLILHNDAMEAMIFNKSVLQNNGLESPYDIVKSGEWTFEKLYDMSRGVSKDLNGDGRMYILDDLFGVILQADTDISFLVSGGAKIASKDENDMPVITYGSERIYRITDEIMRLMLDEENVLNLHRYNGQFGIYDEQVKMFSEDRALFSWIRMRIVERLRGMETDFGLLPLPKLDAAQPDYVTHMNPHTGAGVSIPATAGNLERTGMILEDLAAESRYTLQPAYYELNLEGKFFRDPESREMLDIILKNTAYDIGYIYNFGNFAYTIVYYGMNRNINHASQFERMEPRMQTDIERTIEAYENIAD